MTDLTSRETEVLHLATDGLSNDQIADRLDISRRTVEAHMRTLFRKTGVSRRSQLAGRQGTAPRGPVPDHEDRLDRYDALIRSLVDRHLSLFKEKVEITVTVGEGDGPDLIAERRWTTPTPYVTYRTSRPILADGTAGTDPERLAMACDVHGGDVQADLHTVIERDGMPLTLVIFRPGLATETEWRLRYRSHGLLDPLRGAGTDELYWGTSTMEQRHRPTVTSLALRIVFPPRWRGLEVVERGGAGRVCDLDTTPSGQQVLTWRDDTPTTGVYYWRLTGDRQS